MIFEKLVYFLRFKSIIDHFIRRDLSSVYFEASSVEKLIYSSGQLLRLML